MNVGWWGRDTTGSGGGAEFDLHPIRDVSVWPTLRVTLLCDTKWEDSVSLGKEEKRGD